MLHHFDFYRLGEAGMVGMELEEVQEDPKAICAIEWGDIVNNQLPPDRITIQLSRVASGEDDRLITVTTTPARSYLIEGLQ